MTASFDPLGRDGWDMYQRMLSLIQPVPETNGSSEAVRLNGKSTRTFDVYIEGSGPSSLDCVHAIYARVPILAPVSVAIGMIVVFFVFRSFLNALRFALALTTCLSAALALPTLVYQYGWLAFLQLDSLRSIGDIPWLLPLVTFAVSLGLSTAFDVIWVMTICAPRKFNECGSMYFLGLIVFIAMFGLSLSDVPLMNAVGFATCSATIFACVIVPNALTIPSFQGFSNVMKKY